MARPRETDFLQNHKFALIEVPQNANERAVFFDRAESITPATQMIGCQSISIPEVTVESLEIIEGTEMFTHHINVGRATTGECTISLAVIPAGSLGLYVWVHRAIFGLGVPRKDFVIHHFRNESIDPEARGVRNYYLEGCIPSTYRFTSDMAGDDDAVALEEITFHVHRVKLQIPDTASPPIQQTNVPADFFI